MSKELPFFRFNVSEWLTGNIRYESFDLQGAFITVCAEYWNRENKLTMQDIGIRLNSPDLLKKLIEKRYLKLKNGNVKISFLDEEREIIQAKHLKLSEAGRKGGLRVAKAGLKRGSSIKNKIKNKEIDKDCVELIYSLYPSKCPNRETSTGKTAKDKDKIKTLLQTISPEHLTATITRYVNECRRDNAYMKNFSTFLNNLPDYGTTDTPIVDQYDYSKHDTSLRTMMKIPVTVERLIAKGATLEGLQKRLKELEQ